MGQFTKVPVLQRFTHRPSQASSPGLSSQSVSLPGQGVRQPRHGSLRPPQQPPDRGHGQPRGLRPAHPAQPQARDEDDGADTDPPDLHAEDGPAAGEDSARGHQVRRPPDGLQSSRLQRQSDPGAVSQYYPELCR